MISGIPVVCLVTKPTHRLNLSDSPVILPHTSSMPLYLLHCSVSFTPCVNNTNCYSSWEEEAQTQYLQIMSNITRETMARNQSLWWEACVGVQTDRVMARTRRLTISFAKQSGLGLCRGRLARCWLKKRI